MLANKKITVVLPAYNAAQTLKQTVDEIPQDVVGLKAVVLALTKSVTLPTAGMDTHLCQDPL